MKQKKSFWIKLIGGFIATILAISGVHNADKVVQIVEQIGNVTEAIEIQQEEIDYNKESIADLEEE
jgi:cell division protein FtsL